MRKLLLALIFLLTPISAFAQSVNWVDIAANSYNMGLVSIGSTTIPRALTVQGTQAAASSLKDSTDRASLSSVIFQLQPALGVNYNALTVSTRINSTSNNISTHEGFRSNIYSVGAGLQPSMIAVSGNAQLLAPNAFSASIIGGQFSVNFSGSFNQVGTGASTTLAVGVDSLANLSAIGATSTSAYGVRSRFAATGAFASSTNAGTFYGSLVSLNASSTLSNYYGLFIDSFPAAVAGTITNTYGLYVGDITRGIQPNKAYSLYLSDADARSFIAGDIYLDSLKNCPGLSTDAEGKLECSGGPLSRHEDLFLYCIIIFMLFFQVWDIVFRPMRRLYDKKQGV
jgi:hypothetical protein